MKSKVETGRLSFDMTREEETTPGHIMATGWAHEGAVQEQIDRTVADGVARARSRMEAAGTGLSHCEQCGEPIPAQRREAVPGVRLCVACQEELDRDQRHAESFNRRASKDSQLR